MTHIDEFEEPTYREPDWPTSADVDPHPSEIAVHESEVSDSGVIGAVRRAYRDAEPNEGLTVDGTRHIRFWTDLYPTDHMPALWALGFIGQYRSYTPGYVQMAVSSLDSDKTLFAIGRESKPVVYFWTLEPLAVIDAITERFGPQEIKVKSDILHYPSEVDEGNTLFTSWLDELDVETLQDIEEPVLIRTCWTE